MLFQHINGYKPAKNRFNISAGNAGTLDLGELVPVYVNELMPSDRIRVNVQSIVRLQPLVSPMLQKLLIRFEAFAVPIRILDENFKDFYTGGKDGKNDYVLPLYLPSGKSAGEGYEFEKYDLGDYFGLPVGVEFDGTNDPNRESVPLAYPFQAYNKIINDYYIDENVDTERELDDKSIFSRAYAKDYFTSALPFQQRGNPGAFSWDLSQILDGAHAEWANSLPVFFAGNAGADYITAYDFNSAVPPSSARNTLFDIGSNRVSITEPLVKRNSVDIVGNGLDEATSFYRMPYVSKSSYRVGIGKPGDSYTSYEDLWIKDTSLGSYKWDGLNDNRIVGGEVGSVGFNVADLRYQVQLQRYLERNARAGYRYNEYIYAHFGKWTSDRTIDRVQFIGSAKTEIQVSEIPQTSATQESSAQGTLAGRGIGTIGINLGSYTAEEPCYVFVLQSITPAISYASQGVDRMWTRRTRFDFYTPEFAHLSEQPVLKKELYYANEPADDNDIFGYQGIYDEYRWKKSIVTSDFRDNMSHWKMAREFSNTPELNSDFIHIDPAASYNVAPFAYQGSDYKRYIYDTFVDVLAFRPMPRTADPGYADHF